MSLELTRETEADVACAAEELPGVEGVYVLPPTAATKDSPEAFVFAIVLTPYDMNLLVETHYSVLVATGAREVTGRVLYVNGTTHRPTPMNRARRIVLGPEERVRARLRVAKRRERTAVEEERQRKLVDLAALERAFRQIAEQAARDVSSADPETGSPYRRFRGAISASLTNGGILEIVADPFPSPQRKRILIADDALDTTARLGTLGEFDVVHVQDGWSAIDQLAAGGFDLAICAVILGEFTGARIYRMVVKTRPEMASRFVFLAGESAIAQAPPESIRGRVLARPIDAAAIRGLLGP